MDRRVKYTKMVLRDSLIHLLQDKPLPRITVKAICEGADVNRATYYAHYKDQYDQMDQIELEFISDINAYLDSLSFAADDFKIAEHILNYLKENSGLCRTLLSPNGDIAFEDKVCQLIKERVFSHWELEEAPVRSFDDYVFTYFITGCVGTVKKWLFHDLDKYSPKEMALLITSLYDKGVGSCLRERKRRETT